ncbi:hypothetical protein P280DRAFT_406034 [Massarina eburnea CBS 473.64]|uniref:Complex 1 LYR protein domain-containing protein n=1 Tax=Massarina eburnea CBS 473.64 TaxID=1395130 RepID=A0A6A6RS59_9PLEO|nr:hypothetical protein P280DRAFT_406034 [Massarina eburnea CBS 473.64]
MPRFLPPKKYTPHRLTAIALYRALLSQCSSAPLPTDDRTSLRNAIRNKFRRNRKLQSTQQLAHVFRAGYEVLHRLDGTKTGDTTSLNSLTSLISTLPPGLKRAPPVRRPPPPPDPAKKIFTFPPPERAVLNVRPYAKVSGRRHVPILASASSVPFLRFTKPQPPALSYIIRQKLKKRIKLFHDRVLLSNYWIPLGRQEDEWDELLEREFGVELMGSRSREMRWVDSMRKVLDENNAEHNAMMANDMATARRMTRIVEEETRLAIKEGQTVVRGRKRNPIKSRWLT